MFTFITLNVRGLRNKTKRTSIFRWLKREKADFYLIQEAYCLDTDLEEWKKEWGGEMYINCCTNHSKGLLILVSPSLNSKLNHIVKDVNCRFLYINVTVNEAIYNLWNIYGPNKDNEKANFIDILSTQIQQHNLNGIDILGGDFNFDLDKNDNLKVKEKFNNFLSKFNCEDAWKVKHDNENRFTWQRSNPPCKSTLDYLFIPNLARNDVQNCYIKPAPRTDHLAVILKLKIKNLDKGKGI